MSVLVLVVDDEPDMEALFRQQFRRDVRAGRFDLAFAAGGAQALEEIGAARGRDIILLLSDINMPGMTGLELLRRARALRPELPVMMVTAYGDERTRQLALEGGAAGMLAKPIDFAALRAEIDARLAAWSAGR
ncbi:MAG: response regulator [Acetobacteraceae bacterium]|nr:response regulator [Acetobacteraceae bacterium]